MRQTDSIERPFGPLARGLGQALLAVAAVFLLITLFVRQAPAGWEFVLTWLGLLVTFGFGLFLLLGKQLAEIDTKSRRVRSGYYLGSLALPGQRSATLKPEGAVLVRRIRVGRGDYPARSLRMWQVTVPVTGSFRAFELITYPDRDEAIHLAHQLAERLDFEFDPSLVKPDSD